MRVSEAGHVDPVRVNPVLAILADRLNLDSSLIKKDSIIYVCKYNNASLYMCMSIYPCCDYLSMHV